MKIAVVGATGPTGQLVVEEALAKGHSVVAYVRRPEALTPRNNLTIVGGELDERTNFANVISGCEVLICTLGNRSMKVRDFMTIHLPFVSAAMVEAKVPRLVLMSALGGGVIPASVHGMARLVFKFLSQVVFVDRTRSEAALDQTGLQWSAVYPGFLTDAPALNNVEVVALEEIRDVRNSKIPRANVAKVLVDMAENAPATENARRVVVAPLGSVKHI